MIINHKSERTWNKGTMAYFNTLCQHLARRTVRIVCFEGYQTLHRELDTWWTDCLCPLGLQAKLTGILFSYTRISTSKVHRFLFFVPWIRHFLSWSVSRLIDCHQICHDVITCPKVTFYCWVFNWQSAGGSWLAIGFQATVTKDAFAFFVFSLH
jgi:hypothetical protein